MTTVARTLARLTRTLGREPKAPRATARDRDRALDLLLPAQARAAAGQPPADGTVRSLLRFYLASSAFEQWTVKAAASTGPNELDDPADPRTVKWTLDRTPISPEGGRRLASARTRRDLYAVLFSDPGFLRDICADPEWSWTPAVFLPAVRAPERTVAFLRDLLERGSALVPPAVLAQWGWGPSSTPEDVYVLGGVSGFKANDLFDADYYDRGARTGQTNYFDRLHHYVEYGEAAAEAPNPFVNVTSLGKAHPDLMKRGAAGGRVCVLEHLLERDLRDRLSSALHFDQSYYNAHTPQSDRARFSSPFAHYVNEGWRDGRDPNPCFDELWYLRTHADALTAVKEGRFPNGFSHFVLIGEASGLQPRADFDASAYFRANRDVEQAGVPAFRHFWMKGRLEAREFGTASLNAIARHFRRRLPDTRDIVRDGRLARTSGTPTALLAQVEARGGQDVVSMLAGGGVGPKDREALSTLLKDLAVPVVHLEVGRTQDIHAEDVTRFYISGLASFALYPLRSVRVVSEAVNLDCEFFRYHRSEGASTIARMGGMADDLKSGFMAWFDYSAESLEPGVIHLDLEFAFGDDRDRRAAMAHQSIEIRVLKRPQVSSSAALTQVAMAAYNPPEGPFADQVRTILDNPGTHLLISDDASPAAGVRVLTSYLGRPRIDLDFGQVNANFVTNFERALYMCSAAADVVLFADQDDIWRPEKVARLAALLEDGASCAFSDMRIVDGDGGVISETFWKGRRLHHQDPLALGVANTVTGAAAAFPSWLVEILTPFPRYMGVYHDQWLSVLAAAVGRIAYEPRPLYDYVQHGANVLGFSGSRSGSETYWRAIARRLRAAARRRAVDDAEVALAIHALASTVPLLQRFVLLKEALLRVPVWADPATRELARDVISAIQGQGYDARSLLRRWRRVARRAGGDAALLHIDDMFFSILVARGLVDGGIITPGALRAHEEGRYEALQGLLERDSDPDSGLFERKTAPIPTSRTEGRAGSLRVNIFLPELQITTFFGGYHSKISLISRLRARGVATRIILTDQPSVDYAGLARIVAAFPELETGLLRSEIEAHGARTEALTLTDNDVLLATTWWSAHIVEAARKALGRERFLYFIQEYEPFTFDLGTNYRGAEMTYDFPHDAVFSTELLRDYFETEKLGVFGPKALGDAEALPFRNPITGLRDVRRRPATERRRRLLFYARPQPHASRNMYEFGLAALRRAVAELGPEMDGWEIVGVGASQASSVDLGAGRTLKLMSKLDADGYRQMLAGSDVGLALMYTPHPSLVPLEMAAAGMVTVTNACMTKTARSFEGISDLILVAEPDLESIAESLVRAVRRTADGPVAHVPIDWPTTPDQAFPDGWLDRFLDLAKRSLGRV